jgi:hypothetical protein
LEDKQHKFANSGRSSFRASLAAFNVDPMTSGRGLFFTGDMPFSSIYFAAKNQAGVKINQSYPHICFIYPVMLAN